MCLPEHCETTVYTWLTEHVYLSICCHYRLKVFLFCTIHMEKKYEERINKVTYLNDTTSTVRPVTC
ncbi:hypothetical protein EXN66_Car015663 [Channa argus]|uniref:Uncharacterized protein n=1 Tax=Channa argus TaxID=215402 RepID=A0A6G1QCX5_CHAAH|nr:hypothetical protein EXN66_Car015663 [Channa argus]